MAKNPIDTSERTILVGFGRRGVSARMIDDSLQELAQLVDSAGGRVVGRVTQRGRPHSSHLVGTGKLDEVKAIADEHEAELVVFDDELTPSQIDNIEKHLDLKVVDRSMLILSIFARHAHTKESRTQVELAQYEYLYPRLTGQWSHMTRHVGGIGTRGPGETQLETDRRLVAKRIQRLKKQLKEIDKERSVQRRGRGDLFKAVFVGYTNAGKSTLFNRLTRAKVWAENRLFCTLDPTVRVLAHDDARHVILTDTIGFIRKLPASVFAAFRATLSEVAAADLILLTLDYSDPLFRECLETVESSLAEIGADRVPRLYILNKIDRLDEKPVEPFGLDRSDGEVVAVSATKGIGIDRLIAAILARATTGDTIRRPQRARTARARVRYEKRPPT